MLRGLGRLGEALVLLALVYTAAALVGGSLPTNLGWRAPGEGVRIYVEDNGIHTSIVVPVSAAGVTWDDLVRPEHFRDPRYAAYGWRGFGWGDQEFYLNTPTWDDTGLTPQTQYFYQVVATSAYALDSTPSPSLAVATLPTPYESWAAEWLAGFSADDQLPGADPNHDGLPNLVEFALGENPAVPPTSPAIQANVSNSSLQISFLRARADLTYEVLASSDLSTWTVIATNPGTVGQSVTVTYPVSLVTAASRFLRLRVTASP